MKIAVGQVEILTSREEKLGVVDEELLRIVGGSWFIHLLNLP